MKAQLKLLQLYECPGANPFTVGSTHRLIWFDREENLATLIRTDQPKLTKPKTYLYDKVTKFIEEKVLVAVPDEASIPHLKRSDKIMEDRYPAGNRKAKPDGSKPEESYPLEYRKLWTPIVREIVPTLPDVWRKRISLRSIIQPICAKYDVCENETYQVVYRFLVNGNSERSIVPHTFNCGNPGETRIGNGAHLGRTRLVMRDAGMPNDNFPLDDDWLTRMRDTYRSTVSEGITGRKAYREFKNTYCVEKWELVNEKLAPKYLPERNYPSERQYLDHGHGDNLKEELTYKKLPPLEYELNCRALDGYREPLTLRTGLGAQVDASSNDEYLVSTFNRNQALGTCRTILVVEERIGYIWGMHPTWRVNKEAAKLAILNAASDKAAFCARYGIIIEPGVWLDHLHSEYDADKGELNSEPMRETFSELNCSIEYAETGRGDQKGMVEYTHKPLHNHDSKASTKGRNRKRGEKDPARLAHKNIFEYTRQTIRRVIYHNNFDLVPHLLTTEMRQAGVKATRRAIIEFCIDHGYHHEHHYNEADLVIELCPEFDATVTRNGVYPVIKRNLDSGDEIMLKDLRYLGKFAEEHHWLEIARQKKRWRIKIRMNPNDPRKAWYEDPDEGLQEFTLASKDPLIGKLASVNDILHWQGAATVRDADLDDEAHKELGRIELQEKAENAEIIRMQEESAKKDSANKKLKGANAKNRRDALKREVEASGQSPVPVPIVSTQECQSDRVATNPGSTNQGDSTSTSDEPSATNDNVIPFKAAEDSQYNKLFDQWLNNGL